MSYFSNFSEKHQRNIYFVLCFFITFFVFDLLWILLCFHQFHLKLIWTKKCLFFLLIWILKLFVFSPGAHFWDTKLFEEKQGKVQTALAWPAPLGKFTRDWNLENCCEEQQLLAKHNIFNSCSIEMLAIHCLSQQLVFKKSNFWG